MMKPLSLGIALALVMGNPIAPAIALPGETIAQVQNSEIDTAIAEGILLVNEGSVESLRKAIMQLERAAELSRLAKAQEKQVLAFLFLGKAYNALGESRKVIDFSNQALMISREINDRKSEAIALNNLGLAYDNLGERQKAIEYHNQALPIRRAVNDRQGEMSTLLNLGFVYINLGESRKAIEYSNQALLISREIGERLAEAIILSNLGGIHDELGEKQKAIEYYNQSLLISRKIGARSSEASTLTSLSIFYDELGEREKATEYLSLAFQLYRITGNRIGEAKTLNNLGSLYFKLGETQKAIEYVNLALKISLEIGSLDNASSALNNLGTLYESLGEREKSLKYLNLALEISLEIGDRSGAANILSNIGSLYNVLGDDQEAFKYCYQALILNRAVGNRRGEARALNDIAILLSDRKNLEWAITFFKQSVNVYESLRKDIRKLPRETQELYTSSVANTYRQLADLLLIQNRFREAQSILELLKVQENQEFENSKAPEIPTIQFPTHPLESQTLQSFEKSIAAQQPLTLESLTAMGQPLTQNRDRITQEMNSQEIAIGNPKAILQANPNTLFIQNLVVGNTFWVLWTNANGITKAIVVPNVTQAELTTTVQEFQKQINTPNSNLKKLQTTSQKLYNWLIPPALQAELQQNPKQQLLFSLDHVTRYIPVAALHDGNQYLTQRYSLANLITTDTNMTDRLSNDRTQILALGTSKAVSGFNALPNVDAELNAIVRTNNNQDIYPGKIYLDENFVADRLTQNLDNYSILHIATHGVFNPKTITASYLLLGNGDRLPITSIASLNTLKNTHLIVLSACETGISGAGQDGTEISGISSYFLRRGAKSVMASLWKVDDSSTALMMQQFYQRLSQDKLTKSQAIQQVQQDLISGKLTAENSPGKIRSDIISQLEPGTTSTAAPDFSHPYYWAPFILIGNSN